ncbi:MAG: hypothetical protein FWE21_04145 [Defluviitaleaceae bacterium]|nr:hypothetical protein [Defluviitaleaceae bacterium]
MAFIVILWALNLLVFVLGVAGAIIRKGKAKSNAPAGGDFKVKSLDQIEGDFDKGISEEIVRSNPAMGRGVLFTALFLSQGYIIGSIFAINHILFTLLSVLIFLIALIDMVRNKDKLHRAMGGERVEEEYKLTTHRALLMIHLVYFGNFVITGNSLFEILI